MTSTYEYRDHYCNFKWNRKSYHDPSVNDRQASSQASQGLKYSTLYITIRVLHHVTKVTNMTLAEMNKCDLTLVHVVYLYITVQLCVYSLLLNPAGNHNYFELNMNSTH